MNLPIQIHFWREKADCARPEASGFSGCGSRVSVGMSPKGSHPVRRDCVPSYHRYPSPAGRFSPSPNWPPGFFPAAPQIPVRLGLETAYSRNIRVFRWNSAERPSVNASYRKNLSQREHIQCAILQKSLPFLPLPALPLVATRWANRPSSAAPWARAPQLRSMAMSRPAPWSARRATSPIAGPIRNAADLTSRKAARLPVPTVFKATRASRPGGLFRGTIRGAVAARRDS